MSLNWYDHDAESESESETEDSQMAKKTKKPEQQVSPSPRPPPPPLPPPPPQPQPAQDEKEESESETESEPKQMQVKRKRENESEENSRKEKSESETDEDEPPKPKKKQKRGDGSEAETAAENGEKKKPRKKEVKQVAEDKSKKDDDVVEVTDVKTAGKKTGWQPKDELILAYQMLDDVKNDSGLNLRNKPKSDEYWDELFESLKGKLSNNYSRDQIFDKHKRMKTKLKTYEASNTTRSGRKRSRTDNELHEIFKQLWGGEEDTATPGKRRAHSDAEDSGDTTGLPLLSAVKKEAVESGLHENQTPNHAANGTGQVTPNPTGLPGPLSLPLEQLGPAANFGAILCSGVESMIKLYQDSLVKVLQATSEEERKRRREERKRMLKEQAAEYARMKNRLKLVMELCEQEEEAVKKMLEEL